MLKQSTVSLARPGASRRTLHWAAFSLHSEAPPRLFACCGPCLGKSRSQGKDSRREVKQPPGLGRWDARHFCGSCWGLLFVFPWIISR